MRCILLLKKMNFTFPLSSRPGGKGAGGALLQPTVTVKGFSSQDNARGESSGVGYAKEYYANPERDK